MKKSISFSALVMMMVFAVSCGSSNTQTIGKNVDPDVTSLANVTSYTWTSDIDKIPDTRMFVSPTGVYVYNNESTRKQIKDAIQYELEARGYTQNSYAAGDKSMLVSFYVLEQADTLRTTNGYITTVFGEPLITKDDVNQTPVEPGTLIVNIIDGKSKEMVWQGFASGILKADYINDEAKVREAVSSIFSKFVYKADT